MTYRGSGNAEANYSTNLAPVYLAEQIFFHVLLRGGEGNPFHRIASKWFVELAAPKIRELLTPAPAPSGSQDSPKSVELGNSAGNDSPMRSETLAPDSEFGSAGASPSDSQTGEKVLVDRSLLEWIRAFMNRRFDRDRLLNYQIHFIRELDRVLPQREAGDAHEHDESSTTDTTRGAPSASITSAAESNSVTYPAETNAAKCPTCHGYHYGGCHRATDSPVQGTEHSAVGKLTGVLLEKGIGLDLMQDAFHEVSECATAPYRLTPAGELERENKELREERDHLFQQLEDEYSADQEVAKIAEARDAEIASLQSRVEELRSQNEGLSAIVTARSKQIESYKSLAEEEARQRQMVQARVETAEKMLEKVTDIACFSEALAALRGEE